jgi:hypothetical protein
MLLHEERRKLSSWERNSMSHPGSHDLGTEPLQHGLMPLVMVTPPTNQNRMDSAAKFCDSAIVALHICARLRLHTARYWGFLVSTGGQGKASRSARVHCEHIATKKKPNWITSGKNRTGKDNPCTSGPIDSVCQA